MENFCKYCGNTTDDVPLNIDGICSPCVQLLKEIEISNYPCTNCSAGTSEDLTDFHCYECKYR